MNQTKDMCFPADIKYMFLVGGFSESPMLQQYLRREFGDDLKMIIPQDVGLSIVKGRMTHLLRMIE